jgi:hypothetical protein
MYAKKEANEGEMMKEEQKREGVREIANTRARIFGRTRRIEVELGLVKKGEGM